ncbi:hypothetical protein ACLOJK_018173 [Asimina triloba]
MCYLVVSLRDLQMKISDGDANTGDDLMMIEDDLELKTLSKDDGEDRKLGRKLGFGKFSDLSLPSRDTSDGVTLEERINSMISWVYGWCMVEMVGWTDVGGAVIHGRATSRQDRMCTDELRVEMGARSSRRLVQMVRDRVQIQTVVDIRTVQVLLPGAIAFDSWDQLCLAQLMSFNDIFDRISAFDGSRINPLEEASLVLDGTPDDIAKLLKIGGIELCQQLSTKVKQMAVYVLNQLWNDGSLDI